MTRQIVVPFAGEGSGVCELTWGQNELWPVMQREGSSLNFGGWFPLPPGRKPEDVAGDLSFLMGRHQALRTRLRFEPDGQTRQVVSASGTAILDVVDTEDDDPEEVAHALHDHYEAKPFDYAGEWPIRWGVVVSGDAVLYLVSVICHLASDGMGAMAMLDDLASRDPATGEATGPVAATPLLELSRLQQTPAADRQNRAALRYWEGLLRAAPAVLFPGPGPGQQDRYWQVIYASPAGLLAAEAISARTEVSISTVLLAAWAVSVTRVTGRNPAVIQAVADNRFRRVLMGVVSPVSQFGLCVIDLADSTFDEAVRRAWRVSVQAYKYAYCDPLRRTELIDRICAERGEQIDIRCFINDRRMITRQPQPETQPTAEQVKAALGQSELTWGYQQNEPAHERCYLHVIYPEDRLHFELRADTCYLSPAQIEACLRGIEDVLVEAALEPDARTGIPRAPESSQSPESAAAG